MPTTLPNDSAKLKQAAQNQSEDVLEMVKLGEINAAIAPLSITAGGLAQLGFQNITTDPAARLYRPVKLYRVSDFPRMRQAIIQHLAGAQLNPIDQQAA